jgi:hypothetical protein
MTIHVTVRRAEPTAPRGVDASREALGMALVYGCMSSFGGNVVEKDTDRRELREKVLDDMA